MSKVIFFDDEGEPQGVSNFVYEEDAEASGGVSIPEDTEDQAALDTFYLSKGEIRSRPLRPSQYHFWNKDLEVWEEDLTFLREQSLRNVDGLAEQARSSVATPGSGQAMTYEVKHQEAMEGGGPMLQAEADALGMTLQEVVDSVLAARQAWLEAGGQIEAARLKAKKDIRAATTANEMHQITKALQQELSS